MGRAAPAAHSLKSVALRDAVAHSPAYADLKCVAERSAVSLSAPPPAMTHAVVVEGRRKLRRHGDQWAGNVQI